MAHDGIRKGIMTARASYETPQLTEIGSIRSVTQANHLGFGHDGWMFFGAGTPVPTTTLPRGHHGS
jgi:hypothetical protein